MLLRLVSNSQPQVICLPQPPKVLGLQVWVTTPNLHIIVNYSHSTRLWNSINYFYYQAAIASFNRSLPIPTIPYSLQPPVSSVLLFFLYALGSRIHLQNMQVCYIVIHMPWWLAAPINLPSTLGIYPNAFPPLAPHPLTGLSVWCSPPCIHMFSLFNSYLWVRICGVWFSVPVLVCWEWQFPDSSMVSWWG